MATLGLTSGTLFALVLTAAIVLPFLTVWRWRRGGTTPFVHAERLVMIGLCQGLAVMVAFLAINNQYGFYTSWADVAGRSVKPVAISANGLQAAGEGTVKVFEVHGRASTQQTLVWLPPQYNQPAYRHHRFPVVMFLTGQPSSPVVVYKEFQFAQQATRSIASHQVKPFVAVFPPLMINPPRDTECTNIPHGPAASSWLSRDVPTSIKQHFRVDRSGKRWAVMGWSTGGFCAAKIMLQHPSRFHAAVGFGAYYRPLTDAQTGNLFDGIKALLRHNDPLYLYKRHGLTGNALLMITGREDHQSWADTLPMIKATRGDPNVGYVAFPHGGHNYPNYRAYLGPALAWVQHHGVFG